MANLLLRWILLAISVWAAAKVCGALGLGFVIEANNTDGAIRFFVGVAVLALLNATLGNLLKLLTLPLNCLTLGLFSLVVNAAILMIAASFDLGYSLKGTDAERFFAAFVGSLLISFISGILGAFLADKSDKDDDGR